MCICQLHKNYKQKVSFDFDNDNYHDMCKI